ncbi:hypothetical protein [Nostoc sp. LPT]|uniref:hypothetical protein n=1 Tax=Nostoc sp. LPT TaxID=2815387 RepID=UPI001D898F27|nr:hypothetical protein [Nostoc sp. LPT]MBN4003389.1 hypothetical protein [Nostoc sp. LPT]
MSRQYSDFAIAHYQFQVKRGWMRCLRWATPTIYRFGDAYGGLRQRNCDFSDRICYLGDRTHL